jgi:hypothetical protein
MRYYISPSCHGPLIQIRLKLEFTLAQPKPHSSQVVQPTKAGPSVRSIRLQPENRADEDRQTRLLGARHLFKVWP